MTSVQTFSKLFLKTLTEGAVTTEAGSLFQYFLYSSPSAVARTLLYLVGVPSRAGGSIKRALIFSKGLKHICLFYEETPSHGPIPP